MTRALQSGYGMPVFRGARWQRGYGQMGYGLRALFGGLARSAIPMLFKGALRAAKRAAVPMVKRGVGSAGKAAVPMVKRKIKSSMPVQKRKAIPVFKKAAKSIGKAGLRKSIGVLTDYLAQKGVDTSGIDTDVVSQTGQGQRRKAKKRRACGSKSRRQQTKRRKRSPVDIFG